MRPAEKPARKLGTHYLRQWREKAELSQEAAAEALGMDRTNLSKIERGLVPYNQPLIEAAAVLYRCAPEDLIMRNPHESDGPWALWQLLDAAQRRQAIRLLAALRHDADVDAA